jgi:O-antigen/teichoic acid export membrane protein
VIESPAPIESQPGVIGLRERLQGRRALWAVLTPAATLTLGLAAYAVASRLLSPGEFGRFAVGAAVLWTMIPFVSLGTPVLVVSHTSPEGGESQRRALRSAAALVVLVAGGVLIAGACAAWLVGDAAGWALTPELWPAAAVGAAAVALTDLRVAMFQADFAFPRQFFTQVLAGIARAVGVWLSVRLMEPDAQSALTGYALASAAVALVMLREELIRGWRAGSLTLLRRYSHLARPGVILALSGILAVLTTQVDTFVAATLLSDEPLASYAAATRLSLAHSTVIGGLATLALPIAAVVVPQGEGSRFVRRALAIGGATGVAAVLGSLLFGGFLIRLLFGTGYAASVPVFYVLSLGFLLNYPGNPVSQLLYVSGRARVMVTVQIAQLLVFVSAAVWVVRVHTAEGLAATRSTVNLAAVAVVIVAAMLVARASSPPSR